MLEPTDPGGEPVQLEVGPTDGSFGFWTLDTDGSVLVVAPAGRYPLVTAYDCEVPSGTCTALETYRTRSDPAFIGADM